MAEQGRDVPIAERDLTAAPASDARAAIRSPPLPIRTARPSGTVARHVPSRLDVAAARARAAVGSIAASFALERERGLVFLAVPVLLCVGAIVYFTLPFEPSLTPLCVSLAAGLLMLRALRHRETARLSAGIVVMVVAGMLAAKIETSLTATRIIGGEITSRVTARVAVVEHRPDGRVRLTLDILDTERPKLRYQPDRVRLTARTVPDGIAPGSVVKGVARLSQPLGPLRPDSYDFAFNSYFEGLGASGFFLGGLELLEPEAGPPLRVRMGAWIERVRETLSARIANHVGGPEGQIAAALVTGARAGIPEDANEALRISGLAHVLSISGLHMALVAGVVLAVCRAGLALFPSFTSRRPGKKYAAVGALLFVSTYLVVSGAAVAAQRAYIMIAVMLVAVLFDRAALTMRNLAIAGLVVLAFQPHEALGPSFQMSFAATAALIAAYGWWSQHRAARPHTPALTRGRIAAGAHRLFAYAIGLAVTSLVAGTATGIFGAWHFQRVSVLGLVANLAAMPIVSVLVMPFAVFGMVLMPFGLDGPAFAVMGKGIEWMLSIATWLARRTPIDAVGAIPAFAVVLLTVGLVLLTLATTRSLRLLAVLPLVAGALAIGFRDLPVGYVSEDSRLVAVRLEDGTLAVNRKRPHAFTINDWKRALNTHTIRAPVDVATADGLLQQAAAYPSPAFACRETLCVIALPSGAVIAHATEMEAAATMCDLAHLIVIADATAANPCPHSASKVVTARHLALQGSAEIRFDGRGQAVLRHAIGPVLRPWHEHRRFSRAARGMEPWRPRKKPEPSSAPADDPGKPDGSPPPQAATDPSIDGSTLPVSPEP